MPGTQAQGLQNNFNFATHIIHNLAHLLYSNVNRSCCGHPSFDLSQDRQLYVLRADLSGFRSHLGCPQQDLFPKYTMKVNA